jgi:hypothetical protein
MPRGRITTKVVKSAINNKDVIDMFQGVMGTGDGTGINPRIVYPKYLLIQNHCNRFLKLLGLFYRSPEMAAFTVPMQALSAYAASLKNEMVSLFAVPKFEELYPPTDHDRINGLKVNYSGLTSEDMQSFEAAYKRIKDSNLMNKIIVTCKNLVVHKKSIGDMSKLTARFLTHSAGLTFSPFPELPIVNFKEIYNNGDLVRTDQARKLVLTVLHKAYVISHEIYELMSSPDIDVGEFVDMILSNLGEVEGQIPRCGEAFAKLRNSVDLLKGNFSGYYRDFVSSNNPTIIMENFVLDVSRQTDSSPKVTAQFRRIITHYRKLAKQHANNPKLRSLFQQVDKSFQELEKTEKKADAEEDEEADEEADEEDDPPSLKEIEQLHAEAAAEEPESTTEGPVVTEEPESTTEGPVVTEEPASSTEGPADRGT